MRDSNPELNSNWISAKKLVSIQIINKFIYIAQNEGSHDIKKKKQFWEFILKTLEEL